MGVVSRFMANPGKAHWNAVKSIMRYLNYLKGTKNKCLCHGKDPFELKGFCDSDMAVDVLHKNPQVAMYSHLQAAMYHGTIGCKRLLLCTLPRLNIFQPLRIPRNRYG